MFILTQGSFAVVAAIKITITIPTSANMFLGAIIGVLTGIGGYRAYSIAEWRGSPWPIEIVYAGLGGLAGGLIGYFDPISFMGGTGWGVAQMTVQGAVVGAIAIVIVFGVFGELMPKFDAVEFTATCMTVAGSFGALLGLSLAALCIVLRVPA
jgi:hypothetical protein